MAYTTRDLEKKFQDACKNGDVAGIDLLISLEETHGQIDIHAGYEFAFLKACENGDFQVVERLLSLETTHGKIDIHTYDDVAFQSACLTGHLPVVDLLLSLESTHGKIDIHARDDWPFETACLHGHLSIIAKLISLQHSHGEIAPRYLTKPHYTDDLVNEIKNAVADHTFQDAWACLDPIIRSLNDAKVRRAFSAILASKARLRLTERDIASPRLRSQRPRTAGRRRMEYSSLMEISDVIHVLPLTEVIQKGTPKTKAILELLHNNGIEHGHAPQDWVENLPKRSDVVWSEREGQPIAALTICPGRTTVYVTPKYRHQGIATKLQAYARRRSSTAATVRPARDINAEFLTACENGDVDAIDLILSLEPIHGKIDIHANDDCAFRVAYGNGYLSVTAKLISIQHSHGEIAPHYLELYCYGDTCVALIKSALKDHTFEQARACLDPIIKATNDAKVRHAFTTTLASKARVWLTERPEPSVGHRR